MEFATRLRENLDPQGMRLDLVQYLCLLGDVAPIPSSSKNPNRDIIATNRHFPQIAWQITHILPKVYPAKLQQKKQFSRFSRNPKT